MEVEINYGNKATINVGNYENINPFYNMKVILKDPTEEEQVKELNRIRSFVNTQLDEEIQRIKSPKDDTSGHRFTEIDGVKYPHVTNIITPDTPKIPDIEMHGKVGTLLDWCCKQFVREGVLLYPDEVNFEGKWLDMFNECYKKMSKQLSKLEITFVEDSIKAVNYEHIYCGELDATAIDEEDIICDFKKTKTVNKQLAEKYFMQMAAYASCFDRFKKMMIITPYKVLESDDIEGYFKKFLVKREEYRERFGV